MNERNKKQATYSVIEKSGAVSVSVGRFLQSDAAASQLAGIKALRTHLENPPASESGNKARRR